VKRFCCNFQSVFSFIATTNRFESVGSLVQTCLRKKHTRRKPYDGAKFANDSKLAPTSNFPLPSTSTMPSLSGLLPGSRSATPVNRQPPANTLTTQESITSPSSDTSDLPPTVASQRKTSQLSQVSSTSGLAPSTEALVNRGEFGGPSFRLSVSLTAIERSLI